MFRFKKKIRDQHNMYEPQGNWKENRVKNEVEKNGIYEN